MQCLLAVIRAGEFTCNLNVHLSKWSLCEKLKGTKAFELKAEFEIPILTFAIAINLDTLFNFSDSSNHCTAASSFFPSVKRIWTVIV